MCLCRINKKDNLPGVWWDGGWPTLQNKVCNRKIPINTKTKLYCQCFFFHFVLLKALNFFWKESESLHSVSEVSEGIEQLDANAQAMYIHCPGVLEKTIFSYCIDQSDFLFDLMKVHQYC